jgi:hypothetical protein
MPSPSPDILAAVGRDVKASWRARAAQQASQPVSPESAARVAVVMTWMDWLRRTEGEEAVKRIAAWALGFRLGSIACPAGWHIPTI